MQEIQQSIEWLLNDPAARHAAMVHLPIAGIGLGLLFAIAAACTAFRSRVLVGVASATFLLSAVGAGLAAGAGEESYERIMAAEGERLPVTAVEREALERHESHGEGGWLKPMIPAVLLAVCVFVRKRVQIAVGALGVAGAVFAMGWVALTAHSGGVLVYEHGLGVPERQVE